MKLHYFILISNQMILCTHDNKNNLNYGCGKNSIKNKRQKKTDIYFDDGL